MEGTAQDRGGVVHAWHVNILQPPPALPPARPPLIASIAGIFTDGMRRSFGLYCSL